MKNIICEPEVAYLTSKKVWTFRKSEDVQLPIEGGYAAYLNEMTRILFSQRSIQHNKNFSIEELDYHKYHFNNDDLKFNREEINER